MNKFIAAAKAKRTTALAENTGTGSKMAGPGRFEVQLISAEIGDNRAKTAKQAKLVYEVTRVIKGNEEDVGSTITEYISQNHNSESMGKRYTVLVNQLLDAGIKEEKISDDDDETLWDAVVTATQAASKAVSKGVAIPAAVDHVETQKIAENGKPYFNNYFIELDASMAEAAPAEQPEQAEPAEQPAPKAKPKATVVKKAAAEKEAPAAASFADDDLPF